MIKKKIRCFIFTLLCILSVQMLSASVCYAETPAPTSSGLFDDTILQKMNQFMLKTNDALHNVMMIGDGLMCYAIHVHYHKVEIGGTWYTLGITLWEFHYPDVGFLLVGLIIYLVGVCMAMSVGMYFVDISFKFGFAIIFMPISIALWPFPPTKSKFADNLSIIIRNSMLFMLVGIGVSFAVKLINVGLLADGAENDFWAAIENDEVEQLTKSFSFFSTHILVVFFSLIYGFKILEGSVNNYLNAFFSDAAFGSESPMHHMGTQAVGMVTENAVKPALSYAKDVATHQAGRAIAGTAKGVGKVFTPQGRAQIRRGLKSGYNRVKGGVQTAAKGITFAVHNPADAARNTGRFALKQYNKGMQKAAVAANKAIHKAGDAAKSIHDNVTAFAPIPGRESWRQAQVGAFNNMVDKITNKVGGATEQVIAHGGGAFVKAATNPVKTYNKAMQAAGKGVNNAVHGVENIARKAQRIKLDKDFNKEVNKADKLLKTGKITQKEYDDKIANAENTRINKIQKFDEKSNELAQKAFIAGTMLHAKLGNKDADWWNKKNDEFKQIRQNGATLSDVIGGKAENTIAHGGTTVQAAIGAKLHNMRADENDQITTEQMREQIVQNRAQKAAEKAQEQAQKAAEKAQKAAEKEAQRQQAAEAKALRDAPKIAERQAKQDVQNNLNAKKDKFNQAADKLQQAEAERKNALSKLGKAQRQSVFSLPKNKDLYKEKLKKAQDEYKEAINKLNQAKADLATAQQEYAQAIEQAPVSKTAKAVRKAQIYTTSADHASISLAPSKILATTFRTVRHPQKQIARIAENFKELKGDDKKIILKKTGAIVLRSAARTINDTRRDVGKVVDTTGSILTSMVQKFGEDLADNSSHGGSRGSLRERIAAQNREQEQQQAEEAERRTYFSEMSGD